MEDELPSRRQERAISSGRSKSKRSPDRPRIPREAPVANEDRGMENPEDSYKEPKERDGDGADERHATHREKKKDGADHEDSPPENSSPSDEIKHMELLALNCSVDPGGWLDAQKAQNQVTGIIFYYGDW